MLNVDLPVTIGGNALSIIGDATSVGAVTEASAAESAPVEAVTNGQDSLGGGSQAIIDVDVPVTVGGNAVSVIGDATTVDAITETDAAPAAPVAEEAPAAEPVADAPVVGVTDGSDSILGGTQGIVAVDAPVTVGGNAVSVIGDATTIGAVTGTPGTPGEPGTPGTPGVPGSPGAPAGAAMPTGMPASAASGSGSMLAATGVAELPIVLIPLAVLLMLAGVVATAIRRRTV